MRGRFLHLSLLSSLALLAGSSSEPTVSAPEPDPEPGPPPGGVGLDLARIDSADVPPIVLPRTPQMPPLSFEDSGQGELFPPARRDFQMPWGWETEKEYIRAALSDVPSSPRSKADPDRKARRKARRAARRRNRR